MLPIVKRKYLTTQGKQKSQYYTTSKGVIWSDQHMALIVVTISVLDIILTNSLLYADYQKCNH